MRQLAWLQFYYSSNAVNLDLALTISRRVLDEGPLSMEEYFAACSSMDIGCQFLLRNVFAVDLQGLYGFENKMTENAVHARLAMRTGLWASLLRKTGTAYGRPRMQNLSTVVP